MTLSHIEGAVAAKSQPTARPAQPDEATVRRMAAEFEALLLNQLTASLNPPQEEDAEEGLFSNRGGLGLSRQMFSEQFAKTMADNGGIGLADMIAGQVSHTKTGSLRGRDGVRALATARALRSERSANSMTAKPIASAGNTATASGNTTNEEYPDAIIISEANSSGNTTAT